LRRVIWARQWGTAMKLPRCRAKAAFAAWLWGAGSLMTDYQALGGFWLAAQASMKTYRLVAFLLYLPTGLLGCEIPFKVPGFEFRAAGNGWDRLIGRRSEFLGWVAFCRVSTFVDTVGARD
jgi:hypothetical protein